MQSHAVSSGHHLLFSFLTAFLCIDILLPVDRQDPAFAGSWDPYSLQSQKGRDFISTFTPVKRIFCPCFSHCSLSGPSMDGKGQNTKWHQGSHVHPFGSGFLDFHKMTRNNQGEWEVMNVQKKKKRDGYKAKSGTHTRQSLYLVGCGLWKQ